MSERELVYKKKQKIGKEIARLQEISIQDSRSSEVMDRISYLNEVQSKLKADPYLEWITKPYGGHSKKAVIYFDVEGKRFEFNSIIEASNATGINYYTILKNLRNKGIMKKGGYFKYK